MRLFISSIPSLLCPPPFPGTSPPDSFGDPLRPEGSKRCQILRLLHASLAGPQCTQAPPGRPRRLPDPHDIRTALGGMKTKWPASREFSAHPGRALAAVGRAGCGLVTANGKPKVIVIPISGATISRDLEILGPVALTQALGAIRSDSVDHGTDALTMAEIDPEVAAS